MIAKSAGRSTGSIPVFSLLVLSLLGGCATSTAPPPKETAAQAPTPPPPPPPPPPAPAEPGLDPKAYEDALLGEFRLRNRSRPVKKTHFEPSGQAPSHDVHAFRRIGRGRSHIVLTVGLGRPGRDVENEELKHVELFAETKEYGDAIADVLSTLGRALYDPKEAPAFKPYRSVKLERPRHHLQFFDLVPAGVIDVAPGHTVTLMKVVPVTADEFRETKQGETQFAGRDDVTPEGAERALMRWAPALSQGSEENE